MAQSSATRPTWAEIRLDNLKFNFKSSKSFIGDELRYMAVVKADAYGHGAVSCARTLSECGTDWFGVALPEEGLELRSAGIAEPILCLGGFWPGQEEFLLSNRLVPVVFRMEQARALDRAARDHGTKSDIHVKLDTGMGRIGIRPEAAADFAENLKQFRNLKVQGLMTHFASADKIEESNFTRSQIARFNECVEIFRQKGFKPEFLDLANSPASVAFPESRGNMVRLGGILYGLGDDVLPMDIDKPELKPVLSLHSRIASIKNVPKGETIGYSRTFRTDRDSMIATIPIGYHDGYRRALSNKASVIINGRLAPVAGRISMDWTILDVTDIPDTNVDDEVMLIGTDGTNTITAGNLAVITDTISYEITCGLGSRIPRKYT